MASKKRFAPSASEKKPIRESYIGLVVAVPAVFANVCEYLPLGDLNTAGATSRSLHKMCEGDDVWERLVMRDIGDFVLTALFDWVAQEAERRSQGPFYKDDTDRNTARGELRKALPVSRAGKRSRRSDLAKSAARLSGVEIDTLSSVLFGAGGSPAPLFVDWRDIHRFLTHITVKLDKVEELRAKFFDNTQTVLEKQSLLSLLFSRADFSNAGSSHLHGANGQLQSLLYRRDTDYKPPGPAKMRRRSIKATGSSYHQIISVETLLSIYAEYLPLLHASNYYIRVTSPAGLACHHRHGCRSCRWKFNVPAPVRVVPPHSVLARVSSKLGCISLAQR